MAMKTIITTVECKVQERVRAIAMWTSRRITTMAMTNTMTRKQIKWLKLVEVIQYTAQMIMIMTSMMVITMAMIMVIKMTINIMLMTMIHMTYRHTMIL